MSFYTPNGLAVTKPTASKLWDHRRGNDFRLGELKLVKNNQDNQIQSITLCNMYFSKNVYAVYNGVWGKAPKAGEFSRIFVLKVTLKSIRWLLGPSCKLQRKLGEQDVLVAPPIILLLPLLPPLPRLWLRCRINTYFSIDNLIFTRNGIAMLYLLLLFSNRAGETKQRQFVSVDSERQTSRTLCHQNKLTSFSVD